jgi:hypothetical protein
VYLQLVKKLVFFLIGVTFVACTEISYKEPQPTGIKPLTKIPSRFHGKYIQDKDTVEFFDQGLRGKENGKEEEMLLSDSLVMKVYKGNYYVSYRDGNVWLLRILSQSKNGDLHILSMRTVPEDKVSTDENVPEDQTQKKIFLDKLEEEIHVIEANGHYIIEPTPKQLHRLVKKGFFVEQDGKPWMKKIN